MSRPRLLVTVVIAIAVDRRRNLVPVADGQGHDHVGRNGRPLPRPPRRGAPKVGVNTLVVELSGNGGQPPPPDSVTFEPVDAPNGPCHNTVVATEDGDGRYRGDVDLSMAGQWEITVRIAATGQVHQAVLNVTTSG